MKTRIAMVLAVLFVIGFVVSVEAADVKTSSELSISSAPETTDLGCSKKGCPKKAECKKPTEDKSCPKSEKADSDKAKAGCGKAKAKGGCSKGK